MSYEHWRYFLSIESDLQAISRYVEFSQENYSTYSTEFARLLLASSSEVDVVAKALCNTIDPSGTHENIHHYRRTITSVYPSFYSIKVVLPRYSLSFEPWAEWSGNANPDWWKEHNNVKHQRHNYFHQANLKNTLLSIAGLFSLVLYYYKDDLSKDDFYWPSFPKMMQTEYAPDLVWVGKWSLPDS